MTIDQMMTEIRETHPEVDLYGWPGNWIVHTGQLYNALAKSPEKHRVVELALLAVRKARPKPMTVAQAREAVKAKYPKATCWGRPGDFYIHFKVDQGIPLAKQSGSTEGQAWKAAAAAIQTSERGATT